MTLGQARGLIGRKVEYRPRHMGPDGAEIVEEGVITSVNDHYVFVRYRDGWQSKATNPAELEMAEEKP